MRFLIRVRSMIKSAAGMSTTARSGIGRIVPPMARFPGPGVSCSVESAGRDGVRVGCTMERVATDLVSAQAWIRLAGSTS